MRAPSLELLRALRSATSNSFKPTILQTCNAARRTPYLRSHSGIPHSTRAFTTSPLRCRANQRPIRNPNAPKTHDRGPVSTETTQTDFGKMDILAAMNTPATSIDACTTESFHLNNGIKTAPGAAIMLLGGEAFAWRPWVPGTRASELLRAPRANPSAKTNVLTLSPEALGLLDLMYPKPDLLVLGTGARLWQLDADSRARLSALGVKVDVMDTANAAAAYNLLATERGVDSVAAAMFPVGWVGVK